MADVVVEQGRRVSSVRTRKGASLRNALGRKSTVAFFLTLPLILLIALLVLYPAFFSLYLATLTKMALRFAQGEKLDTALAWAEGECEGFMRT